MTTTLTGATITRMIMATLMGMGMGMGMTTAIPTASAVTIMAR